MATSKNYGKKSSDHFRDILNPYGEKSNYVGDHNSVGDHNFITIHKTNKIV